jgi:predicted dehydrogenase
MGNLRKLGVQTLSALDPDKDRLRPAVEELGARGFSDLDQALHQAKPDVVLICTPPAFHVSQALQAVRSGAHVFIEKPLSDRMDGGDELSEEAGRRKRVVQVGYNLRFNPGLRKLKEFVEQTEVGRILWGRVEVGQYLPDWRPWQDYRRSYSARRELGGGIILDASHEIDYVMWLLGRPVELACMAGRVSSLDVDVEDCATILLRFASGSQVDVHMDFVQREYSRSCLLVGEQGKLQWNYARNEVIVEKPREEAQTFRCDFDANQMYVSEMEHFFDRIERGDTVNRELRDAMATLRVGLAARFAAAEKKWVTIEYGE